MNVDVARGGSLDSLRRWMYYEDECRRTEDERRRAEAAEAAQRRLA